MAVAILYEKTQCTEYFKLIIGLEIDEIMEQQLKTHIYFYKQLQSFRTNHFDWYLLIHRSQYYSNIQQENATFIQNI